MSACPNCRKPLPRCSICLLHMGTHGGPITTAATSATAPGTVSTREFHKSSDFSSWFTWCQTCRHGGHAVHITQWFKYAIYLYGLSLYILQCALGYINLFSRFRDHSECPVTSCMCQCFSVDSVSSQSFLQLCIS